MTFPAECQYHAPMEPPWDDDGYGWIDYTILSRRTLTARVEHKCDGRLFSNDRVCRKPIMPGERYQRQFVLYDDGSTIELKRHTHSCYLSGA